MKEIELLNKLLNRLLTEPDPKYGQLFLCGNPELFGEILKCFESAYKKRNPDKRIFHMDAKEIVYKTIRALMQDFKFQYMDAIRSNDLVIIENFDEFAGKEVSMETIYNIMCSFFEFNKPFIVTSKYLPREMTGMDDRILAFIEGSVIINLR